MYLYKKKKKIKKSTVNDHTIIQIIENGRKNVWSTL